MILVTTEVVSGQDIVKHIGLVRGNAVRARHLGKDITALFKNLVGGEMEEYTKLLAEAREQALDRMRIEAQSLGANGIVALHFSSSQISQGAAEVLVYGTAVVLKTSP